MFLNMWDLFTRWVSGWQWGNVPSWFSAGSFMAAAFVIIRDRRIRRRHQVDNVGVWGEFSIDESQHIFSSSAGKIVPIIYVKNSSNRPVYIDSIKYEISYSWAVVDTADNLVYIAKDRKHTFTGEVVDISCPPDREVEARGDACAPETEGRPDDPETLAIVSSRVPGSRVQINKVVITDSQQKRWSLVPKVGRRGVAATALMPFALALATSSFPSQLVNLLVPFAQNMGSFVAGSSVNMGKSLGNCMRTVAQLIGGVVSKVIELFSRRR